MRLSLALALLAALASPAAFATDYVGSDLGGADLALADGDTLTGTFTNAGTVSIPSLATVTVVAGAPLEIYAEVLDVDGVLDGTGAGSNGASGANAGGLVGNTGQGPGAGGGGGPGPCVHGGGGGGAGYGGNGGVGGYYFAGVQGPPGPAYGTIDQWELAADRPMGSGGGGGGSGCTANGSPGGSGGGSIFVDAPTITVDGAIRVDGADGFDNPEYSGGGGGGSGGSLTLVGITVTGVGALSARGGEGGDNLGLVGGLGCGGGGGGGGRIKVSYGVLPVVAIDVGGGPPGTCTGGPSVPPTGGQPGTYHTEQGSFDTDLDGLQDDVDNCPDVANPSQDDGDGDGRGDACDNCNDVIDPDSDLDGVCDSADVCPNGSDVVDSDSDGQFDGCDDCPLDVPNDDVDNDGACNSDDQCPNFDDNLDGDGDGAPDGCDDCPNAPLDDVDADGVCDDLDLCPAYDDRLDADGDLVPNDCDACPRDAAPTDDIDGDTVCNIDDLCPNADDLADLDVDDLPDACDNCPELANPEQIDADLDQYGAGCDCDDTVFAISPGADEICDSLDNDCDGELDEAGATGGDIWYADVDGDGAGDPDTALELCDRPTGMVLEGTDCDDTEPNAFPGGVETCDAIDNDCDLEIDENLGCMPEPGDEGEKGDASGCGCDATTSPGLGQALFGLAAVGAVLRRARRR